MNNMVHQTLITREHIAVGGVYLTFSGDYDMPYKFAKVLRIDGDDFCIKLYHDSFREYPQYDPSSSSSVISVSAATFLAWGPPKFPILMANDAVTNEEAHSCAN